MSEGECDAKGVLRYWRAPACGTSDSQMKTSAEDVISDSIDGGPGFERARIDSGLDRVQRVEDTGRGL